MKEKSIFSSLQSSNAPICEHAGTKEALFSEFGTYYAGVLLYHEIKKLKSNVVGIAGSKYGGLPLAVATSIIFIEHSEENKTLTPLGIRSPDTLVRRKKLVEGARNLETNAPVVLVDDVIDSGETAKKMLSALQQEKFNVVAAFFLVARNAESSDIANKLGCYSKILFTMNDIVKK